MMAVRAQGALILLLASGVAHAGELDAEVGVDFLHGDSRNRSLSPGEPAERLSSQDIGVRLRADVLDLDDRLSVNIDYLGREPIGGVFRNATHRLLYRAEVSYEVLEDRLTLGLGRFIPPSAVLLPVDGLRAHVVVIDGLSLHAFGGRRAISTSRRNIELDRYLPAVGGGGSLDLSWGHFDLAAAYARDDAFLLDTEFAGRDYGALNLVFSGIVQPIDELRIGTRETFVDQANIFLGPTFGAFDLDVEVLRLFGAVVFVDYSPLRMLRISADFQYQTAAVVRAGTVDASDVITTDQEPTFLDGSLSAAVSPFDLGWARPSFRVRRRPDRLELRYGIAIDVLKLGLPGLALRGFFTYEDVRFDSDVAAAPDLDRFLWSAALGYSGFDLDVEAGARFIDRQAGPFSVRAPDSSVAADLAPFVLETQRVAFVRAFYTQSWFFAGADFEHSLVDRELRLFLQLGVFVEQTW